MRRAPALLAIALAPTALSCIQFNADCSQPVADPSYTVTYLASPVPVDHTVVRTQESALGDRMTDAFLKALQDSGSPPDVAVDNAGDIRDLGLCVTRTELAKGPLTRAVLKDVIPFSDELVTVRVTVQELFHLLEHGVATLATPGNHPGGQFLQVSGLSYEVDCSKPAEQLSTVGGNLVRTQDGQRVRSITLASFEGEPNVTITRDEADSDAVGGDIVVALSSYLGGGGDKFIDLDGKTMTKANPERYTYTVLEAYLHALHATAGSPATLAVDPHHPRIVLKNCG